LTKKKQEEKSQEYKDNEKKIIEVSDPTASVLKYLQYYEKKHNTLSTEKHTLSSIKCARHTANITTTTTISIQYIQTSQLIEIDYLLAQVKTLKQKVDKNKKKMKHKKKVSVIY
jgi:hypothetical protein